MRRFRICGRSMCGVTVLTSIAVLAMGSRAAWAQFTYPLYGDDTLYDVMQTAIQKSGARIKYYSSGSRQAERNMANLPGALVPQGIGPMSRNFSSSVLAANPGFSPTSDSVVCMDAGIVLVGDSPGYMQNVNCSMYLGAASCDKTCDGHVNPLSIAFGGVAVSCMANPPVAGTSKATTAECAHPQRIAAIGQLAALQGARIDHVFRPDDTFGIQDRFREGMNFDRWCNGRSEGNAGAPGSNLRNEDLDPIRKTCVNEHGQSVAETRCTYYPLNYPPLGQTCYNGDVLPANHPANTEYVPIPCTQGFVVAISEKDPGSRGILGSITGRVALDFNGFTMGLGNLREVGGANAHPVNINTVTPEDFNVRGGFYPLWRRLLLQRNPNALTSGYITADQNNEEMKLYNWATNRINQCDVCPRFGLVAPIPGCSQACEDPTNVVCVAAEPTDTPKMNIGTEFTSCDPTYPCVVNGQTSSGGYCGGTGANCPMIPALPSGFACNLDSKCYAHRCSGTPSVCQ